MFSLAPPILDPSSVFDFSRCMSLSRSAVGNESNKESFLFWVKLTFSFSCGWLTLPSPWKVSLSYFAAPNLSVLLLRPTPWQRFCLFMWFSPNSGLSIRQRVSMPCIHGSGLVSCPTSSPILTCSLPPILRGSPFSHAPYCIHPSLSLFIKFVISKQSFSLWSNLPHL